MTASDEKGAADRRTPGGPRRVLGLDGKSYPGQWLSRDDRTRLAGIVHGLAHDDGLSVRQIIARLTADYDIRRSVGWVAGILSSWTCPRCSGVSDRRPEHPGQAPAGRDSDAPEHPERSA